MSIMSELLIIPEFGFIFDEEATRLLWVMTWACAGYEHISMVAQFGSN